MQHRAFAFTCFLVSCSKQRVRAEDLAGVCLSSVNLSIAGCLCTRWYMDLSVGMFWTPAKSISDTHNLSEWTSTAAFTRVKGKHCEGKFDLTHCPGRAQKAISLSVFLHLCAQAESLMPKCFQSQNKQPEATELWTPEYNVHRNEAF
ncbi:uncharacterized [Tachysurus ichikawai]